jgi:hypothetical protein
MTAELSTGSIVCPNCGAASDEPCTEWCATSDPRSANRSQKLYKRARALTDGHPHLAAREASGLLSGVERPSVNTSEEN